jgi:hypothetical protein
MNRDAIVSSLLAFLLIGGLAQAQAPDQILAPIGGPGGGQFIARCAPGDILGGVSMFTGDDVDGIHPICITVRAPTGGEPHGYSRHFGAYDGRNVQLRCPPAAPAVTGLDVAFEGENTVIVNGVHLFCGLALPNQPLTNNPTLAFDGPVIGGDTAVMHDRAVCPPGLMPVGITGRSGKWLDALSLICGMPPFVLPPPRPMGPGEPIKSIGRLKTGAPTVKNPDVHSICDAARDSLGRNSPAAPNLVAQCRATGGNATAGPSNTDLENIRSRGEVLAAADPSAASLRSKMPDADRRGFDVGYGIWEGNTAPGPGKQRYHDALTGVEQRGFDIAAAYALPRNKYDELVKVGRALAAADPRLNNERSAGNAFSWLGCDIAGGLFGDPARGGQGLEQLDAGAIAIRTSLNGEGRSGFNSCMALHLQERHQ